MPRGEREGNGHRRPRTDDRGSRATSAVVGVVLLLAVTTLLAATLGVAATVDALAQPPAPEVRVSGALSADDGWPDGQVLALTHVAGDALDVDHLAVVVHLQRADEAVRVTALPTRRLTSEHVRGAPVVDRGFAGVDGAIDAAHTDGTWSSGETAEIRIARGRYDVRPGERVAVELVDTAAGAVIAERVVVAGT